MGGDYFANPEGMILLLR